MSKRHNLGQTWWKRIATSLSCGLAVGVVAWSASGRVASAAESSATSAENTPSSPDKSDKTDKPEKTEAKPAGHGVAYPAQDDYINEMVRKGWADKHLIPSGLATDGEYCRRVFLDVIGRVPTREELRAFLTDHSADRKVKLVDRLLGDDYTTEYADNWSQIFTNLLIGRAKNKRDEERSVTNREGMEKYLRDSFARNKSYRKMVYEMVSATGSNKLDDLGRNDAVNFLIGKMEDNGLQATAKTSQYFLGLSVQCTQCHNHPFNEWKQNSFWEFNAFFRQTKVAKTMSQGKNVDHAILKNEDFRGEGNDMAEAELFYELRNGNLKAAYPVFVDGTAISRSGAMQQSDRRTELAKLITKSDLMPRAIVNRLWGHFMGYAFTKPVDDMGPHNLPTHPELLNRMAEDFSKHRYEDDGYDLKQLIKWIVLSEPYQLSSHFGAKNRTDDPALGEKPAFSHFYVRQMSAEQLYKSMEITTGVEEKLSDEAKKEARDKFLAQFVIAFGTDDGGETSTFNGSIPQALMMFNGELVRKAVSAESGTLLAKVCAESGSMGERVNQLFMAGLARKPSSAELAMLSEDANQKPMKGPGPGMRRPERNGGKGSMAGGPPMTGDMVKLSDLWWSILNSNEFIMNH